VPGAKVRVNGGWTDESSGALHDVRLFGVSDARGGLRWRFLPRSTDGRLVLSAWGAEVHEGGATTVEGGEFPSALDGPFRIALGAGVGSEWLWVRATDERTGAAVSLKRGWVRFAPPGEDGGPVLWSLEFDPRPSETGAFGTLASPDPPPEGTEETEVEIWLRPPGRALRRVEVAGAAFLRALRDGTPLSVRLPPVTDEVRVRVLDPAGAAVAGAAVALGPGGDRGVLGIDATHRATTDATGVARFSDLESGIPYFAGAYDARGKRAGFAGPWLPRGEMDVRVAEGRPFAFRPRTPSGTAAPRAQAYARTTPAELVPSISARVSADGWIRFPWMPAGVYRLDVQAHGADGTDADGRPRWRGWRKEVDPSDVEDGSDLVLDPP
jgi:hypothetical protein